MKKVLIIIILFTVIMSCESILVELDRNYIEVDYNKQEIVINANRSLSKISSNYHDEIITLMDGTYSVSLEWFKAKLDKHRRYFTVYLEENDSEDDRTVEIYGYYKGGSDFVKIVQKAKPKKIEN